MTWEGAGPRGRGEEGGEEGEERGDRVGVLSVWSGWGAGLGT